MFKTLFAGLSDSLFFFFSSFQFYTLTFPLRQQVHSFSRFICVNLVFGGLYNIKSTQLSSFILLLSTCTDPYAGVVPTVTSQSVLDDPTYSTLLEVKVAQSDFLHAVEDVVPSVSPAMLRHYEQLREKYN